MKMTNLQAAIEAVADECIAVRMRLLNRAVTRIYDDALRPFGIKVSQMNILVAAGKLGIARPAEVCKRLHLEASTLSRNVERMVARGWLEVVSDEDGRAQPFRLSRKGRELLRRAIPAWKRAQEDVRAMLGDATVRSIGRAAGRLTAAHRPHQLGENE